MIGIIVKVNDRSMKDINNAIRYTQKISLAVSQQKVVV